MGGQQIFLGKRCLHLCIVVALFVRVNGQPPPAASLASDLSGQTSAGAASEGPSDPERLPGVGSYLSASVRESGAGGGISNGLRSFYPHLGELTPETYLPSDAAQFESRLSAELREDVESFLADHSVDGFLRSAIVRVASEDDDSLSYQEADSYASQELASRVHYGHLPSGGTWPVLDRYGRIWQYCIEDILQLAKNRPRPFKDALVALLNEYYHRRGNTTSPTTCPASSGTPPSCSASSPYRTADGTCNNLRNPRYGMAGAPLRRFAKSVYEDGIGKPRTKGVNGNPLPSARKISTTVISRASSLNTKYAHILMQWAQFIDHDFTASPMVAGADGIGLACCADDFKRSMNLTAAQASALQSNLTDRYGCFNIPVPADDPVFVNRSCLGFSRSSTVPEFDCKLGKRSPVNKLTSFVDGSMVYGSTQAEQNDLRSFSGGRLRTLEVSGRRSLLPQKSGQVCNKANAANECFTAGDDRVNEQPGLLSMHTILVREHNRVAAALAKLNPKWNDETIFQETRKIVGAVIQHITFKDFLPIILGPGLYDAFDLRPQSGTSYYRGYNEEVDATVRTEFSSIAYRFGHTLIRDTFSYSNLQYKSFGSFKLQNQYFSPDAVYNSSITEGAIIRGLLKDPAESFDRRITTQVTDHLFETGGEVNTPLDLVALNIQRARDHGIPSYVRLRQIFGMTVPSTFDDLKDTHDASVIALFKLVYADVRDIDGFPGGISERSLPGAILGPLFGKIVAIQYALAKSGDRFFYENDCASVFGSYGKCYFSREQLVELRRASLSRLLCDNADISTIQTNAFRLDVSSTTCARLQSLNLSPWKDPGSQ